MTIISEAIHLATAPVFLLTGVAGILNALGNDAYHQFSNEAAQDYIRDAGKVWLIALPEIASQYKESKSGQNS